jgi:general secretion pathway protein K
MMDNARAQALAEGGIYHGIQQLFNEDEDSRWLKDGKEYEINLAGRVVFITLQDERGKVDLNKAPDKLIVQMLASSEEDIDAQAVTEAILDWRDKDNKRRAAGAEDEDYQQAQYAHGARDGAFITVDELQQVMGVTPALYRDVAGLFTVYSGSPGIDPLTAPLDVLLRLPGMEEGAAQEYSQSRTASLSANDRSLQNLLPAEAQTSFNPGGPAVYSISARVQLPHGGDVVRTAVVHLSRQKANPYSIISWRQGSNALLSEINRYE